MKVSFTCSVIKLLLVRIDRKANPFETALHSQERLPASRVGTEFHFRVYFDGFYFMPPFASVSRRAASPALPT